jgi:hypothetical protein
MNVPDDNFFRESEYMYRKKAKTKSRDPACEPGAGAVPERVLLCSGDYRVSIHGRLHPPADASPADRSRVDCPSLKEGDRKAMPFIALRQAGISLKGEVSGQKGTFRELAVRHIGMRKTLRNLSRLLFRVRAGSAALAGVTDSEKFDPDLFNAEAGRLRSRPGRHVHRRQDIPYTPALPAQHMLVRAGITIKMLLGTGPFQEENFSRSGKQVKIAVHCAQADPGHFFPHHGVDLVRRGMGSHGAQGVQDDNPLSGHSRLRHSGGSPLRGSVDAGS